MKHPRHSIRRVFGVRKRVALHGAVFFLQPGLQGLQGRLQVLQGLQGRLQSLDLDARPVTQGMSFVCA